MLRRPLTTVQNTAIAQCFWHFTADRALQLSKPLQKHCVFVPYADKTPYNGPKHNKHIVFFDPHCVFDPYADKSPYNCPKHWLIHPSHLFKTLNYSSHGCGLSERPAWPTDIFRQCILATLMLTRPLTTVRNADLCKPRVRTKWKARLADRQFSSMHFDNCIVNLTDQNKTKIGHDQ